MYLYTWVVTHVHVCVCGYVNTRLCMPICICLYTHIHLYVVCTNTCAGMHYQAVSSSMWLKRLFICERQPWQLKETLLCGSPKQTEALPTYYSTYSRALCGTCCSKAVVARKLPVAAS